MRVTTRVSNHGGGAGMMQYNSDTEATIASFPPYPKFSKVSMYYSDSHLIPR